MQICFRAQFSFSVKLIFREITALFSVRLVSCKIIFPWDRFVVRCVPVRLQGSSVRVGLLLSSFLFFPFSFEQAQSEKWKEQVFFDLICFCYG